MKKLLRIDTSSRGKNSHSRELANKYETQWRRQNIDIEVIYRDLQKTEIPHVTQAFIEAMYTPAESKTKTTKEILLLSDTLITELKNADTILVSVPMFNFGIPSILKAYIDQVARIGETFSMDATGFTGLLTNKKLIIIAAYGAEFMQMKEMDFVEPYLKSVFGFLGFDDISYYFIEGTSMLQEEELNKKKDEIVNAF